jgi:hypothetical protein
MLWNGTPGNLVQHHVEALQVAALQLRVPFDHLRLGRLQHAVEAAQDGERQDHLAVVRLLVVAAQQVGDLPQEAGDLGEVGEAAGF